jgi:hypothetical protein
MRILKALTLCGILLLGIPRSSRAQGFSPYSDFVGLSSPALSTLQVKLCYLGPTGTLIGSLAWSSTPSAINVHLFNPYHRPGFSYLVDSLGLASFQVSNAALSAMVDSVAALPAVTDGDVDSAGYVSFSMLKTSGGTKAFEAIVNQTNGRALVAKIEQAFASDAAALRRIAERACSYSLNLEDPPLEVTSQVTVTVGGFRRIRQSDEYRATLRITNTSGGTLAAPLTLVPNISGMNVKLLNASGETCAIAPGGDFIDVPVGAGLGAGSHVDVIVRISNESRDRLGVQPQVYSRAGTR